MDSFGASDERSTHVRHNIGSIDVSNNLNIENEDDFLIESSRFSGMLIEEDASSGDVYFESEEDISATAALIMDYIIVSNENILKEESITITIHPESLVPTPYFTKVAYEKALRENISEMRLSILESDIEEDIDNLNLDPSIPQYKPKRNKHHISYNVSCKTTYDEENHVQIIDLKFIPKI